MFEEKLKQELQQIKPDHSQKKRVLAQMEQLQHEKSKKAKHQADTPPKKSNTKTRRFPVWIPAVAASLCVCMICLAVFGGMPQNIPTKSEQTVKGAAVIPATISYEAVYHLFQEIYEASKPEEPGLLKKAANALAGAFGTKGSDEAVVDEADTEELLDATIEYSADGNMNTGATDDGTVQPGGSYQNSGTEGTTVQNESDTEADSEDYSGTNNQVAEVEEADVVKTDGKYIYVLNSSAGTVYISLANRGEPEQISALRVTESADAASLGFQIIDMYVSGDRLIIIGLKQEEGENGTVAETVTKIYDITDRTAPALLKEFAQSGYDLSSRLTDGVLYVFSNVSYYAEPKESDLSTYIPQLYEDKTACPIAEESIHIFDGEVDRQYLLATSVDIDSATRVDSITALGGGDTLYANTESIYVAAAKCSVSYEEQERATVMKYEDSTRLIRFAIEKGKLTAAAEGAVRGNILNQFSMDESKEHFRIVTTVTGSIDEENSDASSAVSSAADEAPAADTSAASAATKSKIATIDTTTTNALFVLDRNLKTVGQIVGLAPGERVYSVRFMGNYGYFVTFRQVDPLFAVDLTDPTAPKVLSALKIPGFSNYLHPYGDGLLLGIGKNADETTGRTDTVKLSMFDISDPANVTERDKTSLDCYYTQVDNTHKAALIDVKYDLIAFMGSDAYYIYGYSAETGFAQKAKLQVDWIGGYDVRGLYIGDYFYICTTNGINTYRLDTFEAVSSLRFHG